MTFEGFQKARTELPKHAKGTPERMELLSVIGWSHWRRGSLNPQNYSHDKALAAATSPEMKETEEGQRIQAYAYAYSLRHRDLNQLKSVIEKLGEDSFDAANAKIIYCIEIERELEDENGNRSKRGGELILTTTQVEEFVQKFSSDESLKPSDRANLLQNAARFLTLFGEDKDVLSAIDHLMQAVKLYDPDWDQRTTFEEKKAAPHGHHIAGLHFRMAEALKSRESLDEAIIAASTAIEMWGAQLAKDPTNTHWLESLLQTIQWKTDLKAELERRQRKLLDRP